MHPPECWFVGRVCSAAPVLMPRETISRNYPPRVTSVRHKPHTITPPCPSHASVRRVRRVVRRPLEPVAKPPNEEVGKIEIILLPPFSCHSLGQMTGEWGQENEKDFATTSLLHCFRAPLAPDRPALQAACVGPGDFFQENQISGHTGRKTQQFTVWAPHTGAPFIFAFTHPHHPPVKSMEIIRRFLQVWSALGLVSAALLHMQSGTASNLRASN